MADGKKTAKPVPHAEAPSNVYAPRGSALEKVALQSAEQKEEVLTANALKEFLPSYPVEKQRTIVTPFGPDQTKLAAGIRMEVELQDEFVKGCIPDVDRFINECRLGLGHLPPQQLAESRRYWSKFYGDTPEGRKKLNDYLKVLEKGMTFSEDDLTRMHKSLIEVLPKMFQLRVKARMLERKQAVLEFKEAQSRNLEQVSANQKRIIGMADELLPKMSRILEIQRKQVDGLLEDLRVRLHLSSKDEVIAWLHKEQQDNRVTS